VDSQRTKGGRELAKDSRDYWDDLDAGFHQFHPDRSSPYRTWSVHSVAKRYRLAKLHLMMKKDAETLMMLMRRTPLTDEGRMKKAEWVSHLTSVECLA
jgi:hypothetical protein